MHTVGLHRACFFGRTAICCITQAAVVFPLKHMSNENKETAQQAISRIQSQGGTNLSGGLFKGIDQHQQGLAAPDMPAEQSEDIAGELAHGRTLALLE